MVFPVEFQPGIFGRGPFTVRDELLLHRDMARDGAKLIAHMMTLVPDRSESSSPFWQALQAVARCSRLWPVAISSLASSSLAEGAREIETTLVVGCEGSCVLATNVAAERLKNLAESVQNAHNAVGGSIEVIVDRHLNDCVVDYQSSTIGQAVGQIDFANLSRVIDREVDAAITWAAKYLMAKDAAALETPSVTKKRAANRKAASPTRTKAETWKLIAAYLFKHHAVVDGELSNKEPLKYKDLCTAIGTSRGGAVTSWFQEYFSGQYKGHREYERLCLRRPSAVASVLMRQQGETLSRAASNQRKSREDDRPFDVEDTRDEEPHRNYYSYGGDDDSDDSDDSDESDESDD